MHEYESVWTVVKGVQNLQYRIFQVSSLYTPNYSGVIGQESDMHEYVVR